MNELVKLGQPPVPGMTVGPVTGVKADPLLAPAAKIQPKKSRPKSGVPLRAVMGAPDKQRKLVKKSGLV